MRKSCATLLSGVCPAPVIAGILGNTAAVAASHYIGQVPEHARQAVDRAFGGGRQVQVDAPEPVSSRASETEPAPEPSGKVIGFLDFKARLEAGRQVKEGGAS